MSTEIISRNRDWTVSHDKSTSTIQSSVHEAPTMLSENGLAMSWGSRQSGTPPWRMLHSNCSLSILPWKTSANVPAGDEKGPLVWLDRAVSDNKEPELIFLILVNTCHLCDVQRLKQTWGWWRCKASFARRLLMREYWRYCYHRIYCYWR